MITVLIPARDEAEQLGETLGSVYAQTLTPDHVVVIPNNATKEDAGRTEAYARVRAEELGFEVFISQPDGHKKAGALNQWLDIHLSEMADDDLVMVMDADSTLDPEFIATAAFYIDNGYDACGGVFQGKSGGGLIGMFQRNEYARYARDVARKKGRTLVLTGTATLFTAKCLKAVVEARTSGTLPNKLSRTVEPHVYDTTALTEDNELTFALLHLGFKIIAPPSCKLHTEVMETWPALWNQRHRWKRGAIENNRMYGFTRHTAKYWGLQFWGMLGIMATAIYLITLVYSIAEGSLQFKHIWLAVTGVYIIERAVSVRSRGWKHSLLGGMLFVEMIFDLFLQAVHAVALVDSLRGARKNW